MMNTGQIIFEICNLIILAVIGIFAGRTFYNNVKTLRTEKESLKVNKESLEVSNGNLKANHLRNKMAVREIRLELYNKLYGIWGKKGFFWICRSIQELKAQRENINADKDGYDKNIHEKELELLNNFRPYLNPVFPDSYSRTPHGTASKSNFLTNGLYSSSNAFANLYKEAELLFGQKTVIYLKSLKLFPESYFTIKNDPKRFDKIDGLAWRQDGFAKHFDVYLNMD